MKQCPRCGNDVKQIDETTYICRHCNVKFVVKKKPAQQAPSQIQQTSPPAQQHQQPVYSSTRDEELEQLKARLAALEAEKQQPVRTSKSNGGTSAKAKQVCSNILTFFKRHFIIIFPVTLLVIAFITLMTCFIGIRGVYVNVEDPNDFYSFTATGYETYSVDMFGDESYKKGTWKLNGANIIFTTKDDDFGKFSMDFVYATKNSYKTLFIGEDKDSLVEYKRVSLVKYDINTKKAKVTFDINGGNGENDSTNIKIGNKIKKPSIEPTHPNGYSFRGWYTEPYGYKNNGTRF